MPSATYKAVYFALICLFFSSPAVSAVLPGESCDVLGATRASDHNDSILACLKVSAGSATLQWKNMTGNSRPSCPQVSLNRSTPYFPAASYITVLPASSHGAVIYDSWLDLSGSAQEANVIANCMGGGTIDGLKMSEPCHPTPGPSPHGYTEAYQCEDGRWIRASTGAAVN